MEPEDGDKNKLPFMTTLAQFFTIYPFIFTTFPTRYPPCAIITHILHMRKLRFKEITSLASTVQLVWDGSRI